MLKFLTFPPYLHPRNLCPKIFERDILKTVWENAAKYKISVQLGTKVNRLDFEVKSQGHDQRSYAYALMSLC